ncbi:hypothetical protein HYV86_05485 [Candidatus Woesearchaeota archaeon]|nr:hypothetical protein [Candidatus Woesearchaeota archaeon]
MEKQEQRINSKRGQVNMTETIAVLLIFLILLIFGIVFYARYQEGAIKEKERELDQRQAIEVTTRALFLPELICTKGNAETDTFCFDVPKLKHIEDITKNNMNYYFQMFGYATITVQELYPGTGNPPTFQQWTIYNKIKIDPNTQEPSVNKEKTDFVVTLRDETTQRGMHRFGIVHVEVYS